MAKHWLAIQPKAHELKGQLTKIEQEVVGNFIIMASSPKLSLYCKFTIVY